MEWKLDDEKEAFRVDNVCVRLVKSNDELKSDKPLRTPEDVVRAMAATMAEFDREVVGVINFRTDLVPINVHFASLGTIDTALVHPREIFKSAILSNAASIMLLHNHPSGTLTPSRYDVQLTDRMLRACEIMEIGLIDHIIVGGTGNEYFSFRTKGMMDYESMNFESDYNRLQFGNVAETEHFGHNGQKAEKDNGLENGIMKMPENENDRFMENAKKITFEHDVQKSDRRETGKQMDAVKENTQDVADIVQEIIDNATKRNQEHKEPDGKKPYRTTAERLSQITEKLEKGIKEFTQNGDSFKNYITTMAKFHQYSFNNIMLIAMQKPDATYVAGFDAWKNKFGRSVNKGEKGIKIIAPAPYKKTVEQEIIDKKTGNPVIGEDGKPKTHQVEVTIPNFQAVTVFDVSQTSGRELPQLGVSELRGKVENFQDLVKALEKVSPVPVERKDIETGAKGFFSPAEQKICIQQGMSEAQEVKTLIHEIAHSLVDDRDHVRIEGMEKLQNRTKNDREVTAEAVAFVVSEAVGQIDTSDYSFGYIAGWSQNMEVPELKESMEIIRKTASTIITRVEQELDSMHPERTAEKGEQEVTSGHDVQKQEMTSGHYDQKTEKATSGHDVQKTEKVSDQKMNISDQGEKTGNREKAADKLPTAMNKEDAYEKKPVALSKGTDKKERQPKEKSVKAEPSKTSGENEKPKKKSLKERLEDKKIKVAEKAATGKTKNLAKEEL